MKKIIYTIILVFTVGLFATPTFAASNADKKELTTEQQVQLQQIQQRVEEIRHMDKSDLTRTEKKELKKELRSMEKQARAITGGGVYLSAGAIIIIILVLILIL